MKNLFLFIFAIILISCGRNSNELTLTGKIEGLQQGDTIFLTSVSLPDQKEEYKDTIIIEQADGFSFKKEIPHTTLYYLSYSPAHIPPIETRSRGSELLVTRGDDIQLKGSIYYISALEKTGGFYQDPLVSRYDSMSNVLYRKRATALTNYEKAREAKQEDRILEEYWKAYDTISYPKELEDVEKYISGEVHDNEFSAYLYLRSLSRVTATQLEERFAKYTPEVKASYMGERLSSMLKILKNIEVGNTPSEFTVTDMNGNKRSLSDYRGKYLLIYHWGLCSGAAWVQPRLLDIYERFHDKGFEVLGFTPGDFFTLNANLKDSPEYKILFNQPWVTVFTDATENKLIEKEYYLSGAPILMLISPDGTTLVRGFGEVGKVKKILEENLQ